MLQNVVSVFRVLVIPFQAIRLTCKMHNKVFSHNSVFRKITAHNVHDMNLSVIQLTVHWHCSGIFSFNRLVHDLMPFCSLRGLI